jgi:hypothetical protein
MDFRRWLICRAAVFLIFRKSLIHELQQLSAYLSCTGHLIYISKDCDSLKISGIRRSGLRADGRHGGLLCALTIVLALSQS